MKNSEKTLDMIVNLCKNRGFIYPGSEIYGGLANSWDYGPLGVEFKNNVKKAWMKKFVQESPYNVGLDAAILMNPQTWVTTGHVGNFSDPLVDCRACKSRNRADKLIADCEQGQNVDVDGMTFDQWIYEFCKKENVRTHNQLKFSIVERNFSNFAAWMEDEGLVEIRREFCAKKYYRT